MINVLFSATPEAWTAYAEPLRTTFAQEGIEVALGTDLAPETVDWIIYAPNGGLHDFTPFTRLKGVQSLWAGVEQIVGNPTLTVPLVRMVDPGLTQGMVEWVVGHVLRYHLGMDADILRSDGEWVKHLPPLAQQRPVAMLGLGALGTACAQALSALNFDMHGWSRSAKQIDGITCHHGDDGLGDILSTAQIVVTLLPSTPATENLLNGDRLSRLPRGAMLINPGRGPLIDDEALIAALDSGQIAQATLDVFRTEPLLRGHPFWTHPNVTVTPHIASETRPDSAARTAAQNIARAQRGQPLQHVVDRKLGY